MEQAESLPLRVMTWRRSLVTRRGLGVAWERDLRTNSIGFGERELVLDTLMAVSLSPAHLSCVELVAARCLSL